MGVQEVVKYIVACHRDGEGAKVAEIGERMQLGRKEAEEVLRQAEEQVKELGYRIVGVGKERVDGKGEAIPLEKSVEDYTYVVEIGKSDAVYIVRDSENTLEENREINERMEDVGLAAMLVILNGGEIEREKLVCFMEEMGRGEDVLNELIGRKYLKRYARKVSQVVRLGWKFFCEFPEFSAEKYVEALRREEV